MVTLKLHNTTLLSWIDLCGGVVALKLPNSTLHSCVVTLKLPHSTLRAWIDLILWCRDPETT